MKTISADVRNKLYYDGLAVYSKALLYVKHKTMDITNMFSLAPNDFTIESNSVIINGGYNFPIGNAISKSIKISLLNKATLFDDYDLDTAVIHLKSILYPDGLNGTPVELSEGIFYADDVEILTHSIVITAYDGIGFLDSDCVVSNANPSTHQKIYDTLWDYFVHLCDDIYPSMRGLPEATGSNHYYAAHLENEKAMYQLTFTLDAIETRNNDDTTLRDILGYVAMISCGNIIMDGDGKIDIVRYSLVNTQYYNGMSFADTVNYIIEGGDLDGTSTGFTDDINGYTLGDENVYVLDNYQAPPTIEYKDIRYNKVTIAYPRPNLSDGKASYSSGTVRDELSLYNPLCQKSDDNNYYVRGIAENIVNRLGAIGKTIKPFTGSFPCNPLLEFADNVIVCDINGTAYNSFVGEHTMNYLGTSEISNHTPFINKDKNTNYS